MEKYSVNLGELGNSFREKKSFRVKELDESKIEKVAFDIVRFVNTDNLSGLWQVKKCDDGDYIVATYDSENAPEQEQTKTSGKIDWAVESDKKHEKLSVYYKDTPVAKLSVADLGIPTNDVQTVCEYLPSKLASNDRLRDGLIADLTDEERKILFKAHPELSKTI